MTEQEQENYDAARAMIESCQEFGWTSLDLSRLGLTAVPPEIGQLSTLRWIALDSNKLTSLPREMAGLTELTHLFLHRNPALEIPESLLGPTNHEVYVQKATPANPADILRYYFSRQDAGKS